MRPSFALLAVILGSAGVAATAATPVGTLGVSAVVVDRCAVVTTGQATDIRCDREMPHRIERHIVVDPADAKVQMTRTTVTY